MVDAAGVHARIDAALEELQGQLKALSLDLHAHPEVAFQEHHAQGRLTEALEQAGFSVQRGLGSLETAFVGRAGRGEGPRVALLMEYDALPNLGHACGHNLIATAGLGAALALRRAFQDELPGELLAMGTPAEEDGAGKAVMVREGAFSGVDAALMFHPADVTVPYRHAIAALPVEMRFYGKAAHAAADPELGRNALNGLIHTFVMIDGLRQHIPETARIHGIITAGGSATNIVPDYAAGSFEVRAQTKAAAEELFERVRACAEGAAAASGVRLECERGEAYAELKNNKVLAGRFEAHLRATGEEVAAPAPGGGAGSTDLGNVSLELPAIHPYVAITAPGVAGHSTEFAEAAGSARGQEAMLHAAAALAHTAADLLLEPQLVEDAWESFRTTGPDLPR